MEFHKYHGLGNDFVLVDQAAVPAEFSAKYATRLCDRHTGIGADGVLIVAPPPANGFDAEMIVFNADGSRAEMCGNGLRCVAFHLLRHHDIKVERMTILTGAGAKLVVLMGWDGDVPSLQVDMGPVTYDSPDLPVPDAAGEHVLTLAGGQVTVCPASVGNPHAVIWLAEGQDPMAAAQYLGPHIEHHPDFPNRVNAELVAQVAPGIYQVVVYERGAGITRACGTGATAVAAVAIDHWGTAAADPVEVRLPGGALHFERNRAGSMLMTGPAEYVFSGEWTW